MPELGQYAGPVLAAYGVAIVLLLGLTGLSLQRGAIKRRQLAELEKRRGRHG